MVTTDGFDRSDRAEEDTYFAMCEDWFEKLPAVVLVWDLLPTQETQREVGSRSSVVLRTN